ncbi:MAG: hypothetical protein ABIJ12_08550 [bacterium]
MNCDRFKEELFDYLGFDILPETLSDHLNECEECRNFWMELQNLGDHLGTDEKFYPDEASSDGFVWEVNARIDELEIEQKETLVKLVNYLLPIAASIIILLGISLSSGYLGNTETNIVYNISTDLNVQNGYFLEDEEDEMEVQFVDELLNDYSASVVNDPSEQLLDDLTNEEMEYLKENFNAGDILL